MAATGYPQVLAVPSLYRVVRTLSVTASTTVFDITAAPVANDVLAEVHLHYPSATADQIRRAAIIKQIDVQNTGYNTSGASATTPVLYFEHADSSTPAGPQVTGGATTLYSGSAASYPSSMTRAMSRFYLKAIGAPAVAQAVNVIVWFDVPGFGS
jgi:hypothetical protein